MTQLAEHRERSGDHVPLIREPAGIDTRARDHGGSDIGGLRRFETGCGFGRWGFESLILRHNMEGESSGRLDLVSKTSGCSRDGVRVLRLPL